MNGTITRKLQGWSIGSLALLLTLFTQVAGIADDGKQQAPVPTSGGESYVTLRSVLSDGERRIELARGDNKQTAYRFVLKIDAEEVEITPGPNDQIKIVQAGLEILSNQVMFRTNLEKLQITATVAPEEHLDNRSTVIPLVEIADLHPGLDNQEVEMAFIINEEYMISGNVPVGHVASFGIEPQLKSGEPKLSVLVSGDCADALSRSGLGPDLNQAKGVIIQAVGRLVLVPPPKDRPNDQLTYQLRINDWKKCRVLSRMRPVIDNPSEFGPTIGPTIGPEIGPADKPRAGEKDSGVRIMVPAFDLKIGMHEESSSVATFRLTMPALQAAPLVWDGKRLQITEEVKPLQFDIGLVR